VTTPDVVVVERPDPGLRESIRRPLAEFNVRFAGGSVPEPIAIVLRDPTNDAVVGGLWAVSAYHWIYVDLLFVPENLRGRGLGSALMKKAEEIAAQRGCIGLRLDTLSFQAPRFYEKLGYREYGRLASLPNDRYERIYYFKMLSNGRAEEEDR
jgi:GNAT superfamily N-acetyltransferase